MFAFVLYDNEKDAYLSRRDHLNIIPLYMDHDAHVNRYVASEMKSAGASLPHYHDITSW